LDEKDEEKAHEVLERLKWWRLGSKDEEEHGYRMIQSNFGIKLTSIREIKKESEDLLNQHNSTTEFFMRF
jgi:hypothetical protein